MGNDFKLENTELSLASLPVKCVNHPCSHEFKS